jgi:hypothetical protein
MPDSTRSQIAYEQAGLGSVLKHNQLVVPPNQREYAWQEEQVTQLLQDLARAVNNGSDYFLGTVVTIPRLGGALEVVDGQQRLATTAILLAAIRDYLRSNNEEVLVESINNEFLTGIDRGRRTRVPRLKLNVDDNDLFRALITKDSADHLPVPSRPSHERLLAAYVQAQSHVANIVAIVDANDHGDTLDRWVSFLELRALVVLLRVPDDADAYKMFETLNDRGLRTSQADLIKNHLFGRSGDRFSEVQSRWSYMRGALDALDDEEITINFLRHALIVMTGYRREVDVYDTVQSIAKSEQATVTFATTLETFANVYVSTYNGDNERWNSYPSQGRAAIEVLNLFNIKPLRPLILAIAARMDRKPAAASLEFVAVLGVRLIIASSTRSGSVEQPLAAAAHSVFQGEITDAAALKRMLAVITPTDQEFQRAFATARVSNARLARYYLRSLEMAAKEEAEPWFIPQTDRSVINLEHVLPRKPEANWPDWTEDDVRLNTTRLGNQVLLRASDNSNLKSSAFAKKRETYKSSPYVLTSQLADCDEWTPATISERQERLAELAVRTWPV